jgi:predicted nucleotidyltransferase
MHVIRLMDVKEILGKHRDDFLYAYVFGSVARGDQDEHSDVDILLVRDTQLPFFDRLREVFDLYRDLGKADLLIYTEGELESVLKEYGRYFIKDIVRNGVKIEGKQRRSPAVVNAGGK